MYIDNRQVAVEEIILELQELERIELVCAISWGSVFARLDELESQVYLLLSASHSLLVHWQISPVNKSSRHKLLNLYKRPYEKVFNKHSADEILKRIMALRKRLVEDVYCWSQLEELYKQVSQCKLGHCDFNQILSDITGRIMFSRDIDPAYVLMLLLQIATNAVGAQLLQALAKKLISTDLYFRIIPFAQDLTAYPNSNVASESTQPSPYGVLPSHIFDSQYPTILIGPWISGHDLVAAPPFVMLAHELMHVLHYLEYASDPQKCVTKFFSQSRVNELWVMFHAPYNEMDLALSANVLPRLSHDRLYYEHDQRTGIHHRKLAPSQHRQVDTVLC